MSPETFVYIHIYFNNGIHNIINSIPAETLVKPLEKQHKYFVFGKFVHLNENG